MNENISQVQNYEGLKALECYMKKKKNKNNSDLREKTSYKYFIIDLELRKFFIKINKESSIFSKEFNVDSLSCFKSELDKEDIGLCDFKFGFQFLINSKKYVLYQKDERDYFDWIRLLEFHFNKKDIGSFAHNIAKNQNKKFSNIHKNKNAERSKSVIADFAKIDDNFILNNIQEDKHDNKSFNLTNTNKTDLSDNKAKIRATMITDKIIEDKDLNKLNKNLLTKNIINQLGLTNNILEKTNNNKNENVSPESKKFVLKLLNKEKKNETIEYKNEFNDVIIYPVKNYNFGKNIQNSNEFNFKESPIDFVPLKCSNVEADSQHLLQIKSNKFQSNSEIDKQFEKNDFFYRNKINNDLEDSLESEISIKNKINGNYIPHDDFFDFPIIEKSKNKKIILNDNKNNNHLSRDSLLKDINFQNERRQVNMMNQKEILTKNKIICKSPIFDRNEKKNELIFYELNQSYFKETPIKKDIERDKIILENLHYGIDHSNLNKFDNDLKVTIAGVPMTMINKVNFYENDLKPEPKKTFKKRANIKEENTFDSKQVITKSGNIINVKKTIVPGENESSWTLNLSVVQEKKKIKK